MQKKVSYDYILYIEMDTLNNKCKGEKNTGRIHSMNVNSVNSECQNYGWYLS